MDREAFVAQLEQEGFAEVVTVDREPSGALDTHEHPFEAKALIVDGEMHIRVGDEERFYQVGDVFYLAAHLAHSERYGPNGVRYLVGRK
ncbi:cupin domain-containing protein [Paraburkholderia sp. DHOC27]|uniref:cupin domain-containing protein n=1 Tax=Paraburkholderia sp. DHOC27 TaxID=2303330 RepID=UPI000E3DD0EF|nr:cupin domain-containing protein [Paraburkholderia sp. DHOC27]RFU48521.1 cupin domain-containing protein [Paraburkholderia sp. DHOC27]